MKKFLCILLIITNLYSCLFAQANFNASLDNAKSGLLSSGSNLIQGFGESFGWVPADKVYSYMIWNDSPLKINVTQEKIVSFFGAQFKGQIDASVLLLPFQNTGNRFYNEHLLFTIWLLRAQDLPQFTNWMDSLAVMRKLIDIAPNLDIKFGIAGKDIVAISGKDVSSILGKMDIPSEYILSIGKGILESFGLEFPDSLKKISIYDKTIPLMDFNKDDYYYYRVYYDAGGIHAEYLGINATTDQFAGVFYNNTPVACSLTFLKDNKEYTVTLEPNSFSMLQSSSGIPNSIRPSDYFTPDGKNPARTFTFKQGNTILAQIPIAPQGIAGLVCDPETKKCTPGDSLTYTYQVFMSENTYEVGMQGLAVGNHAQPVPPDKNIATKVVRDINPVACHMWCQSANQFNAAQKDASTQAFDVSEQLWIYYQTKDYTFQQKVAPGSIIDFTLIRPQLSEGKIWLYVASIQTNDDKKALQFLQRLATGKIGADVTTADIQDFSIESNLKTVLVNPQINDKGIIDDTAGSGVTGAVLLVDGFLPRGMGPGPLYYTVVPPLLGADQLVDTIMPYVTTTSDQQDKDVRDQLSKNIPSWINTYKTNPESVTQQVTQFLQQYADLSLFKNPQASSSSRTFNDLGTIALNTILTGPVSIKNPPLWRQAGINNSVFTFDKRPDDWPSK